MTALEQLNESVERFRYVDPLTFEVISNVASARRRKALTQLQLAKKAGTVPSVIFLIEHGRSAAPSIRLLLRLAVALRVNMFELAPLPWFARQLPRDLRSTRDDLAYRVKKIWYRWQLLSSR